MYCTNCRTKFEGNYCPRCGTTAHVFEEEQHLNVAHGVESSTDAGAADEHQDSTFPNANAQPVLAALPIESNAVPDQSESNNAAPEKTQRSQRMTAKRIAVGISIALVLVFVILYAIVRPVASTILDAREEMANDIAFFLNSNSAFKDLTTYGAGYFKQENQIVVGFIYETKHTGVLNTACDDTAQLVYEEFIRGKYPRMTVAVLAFNKNMERIGYGVSDNFDFVRASTSSEHIRMRTLFWDWVEYGWF